MFTKWAPAIAIGLTLVIAACSSGDSTSGSPTPTPTPISNGTGSATPTPTAGGGNSGSTETGTSTPTPAGAIDPCSVVTQDQVAAAVGQPVGPGEVQNDDKQCMWEYSDPSDEFTGLDVSLAGDTDPEVWREDQQNVGTAGISAVSGVGDEAYFAAGGLTSSLDFRKGDKLYDVGFLVTSKLQDQYDDGAQQAVETQIALDALPKLP